jgi:predicted phosphodiesterase
MKIAVCSDIHLEFGPIELKNPGDVDVLVLSGDICVDADLDMKDRRQSEMGFARKRSEGFHEFFEMCGREFPHVIYVAGNHEHYHGDYAETLPNLKRKLAYIKNLYVLDREVKKIDDVTFIGGTLWTDMNKEDPLTLFHIKRMMNDFRCVKNSNRKVYHNVPLYKRKEDDSGYELDDKGFMIEIGTKKKESDSTFCPEDAVEDHRKMVEYINVVTAQLGENTNKYVVCGHHAPSRQSTHPRYKDDTLMNGGYSSDLEDLILNRPCIKLWTHGHTHEPFDYMIGETRIVCNPRGYIGYESRASEFELKVVEV